MEITNFRHFLVLVAIFGISRGKSISDVSIDGQVRAKRAPGSICPSGKYHDEVTGQCDPCAPHCLRTFEKPPSTCEEFCSQMTSTINPEKTTKATAEHGKRCPKGTYLDSGTSNCDPCLPHCTRMGHEVPPGSCMTFCTMHSVTTTPPTPAKPKEKDKSKLGTGAVAGVSVAASLVLLVALVGIIVICRHKQRRHEHTINLNGHVMEERQPFKPSIPEQTLDTERTSEMVTAAASAL